MSALQQSGAISLTEIANEFGVTSGVRNLKDFYRGGSNVSNTDLVTSSATNAPSDNNPVSNFASVTGLTCTRTSTTTTSSTTLGTQQVIIGKGNPPVTGTKPVTVGNSNSSDFVFKQLIDNEDPSNNSGAVTVTMQGSSGTTRTASLQSNPTGHPVLGNGPYTITNNANRS